MPERSQPGNYHPHFSVHRLRQRAKRGQGEAGAVQAEVERIMRTKPEGGRPDPHVLDASDVAHGLGLPRAQVETITGVVRSTRADFHPKGGNQRIMHARARLIDVMKTLTPHIPSDTRQEILRRAIAYWKEQAPVDLVKQPTARFGIAKSEALTKARYIRRWRGPNGEWRYEYPDSKEDAKAHEADDVDKAVAHVEKLQKKLDQLKESEAGVAAFERLQKAALKGRAIIGALYKHITGKAIPQKKVKPAKTGPKKKHKPRKPGEKKKKGLLAKTLLALHRKLGVLLDDIEEAKVEAEARAKAPKEAKAGEGIESLRGRSRERAEALEEYGFKVTAGHENGKDMFVAVLDAGPWTASIISLKNGEHFKIQASTKKPAARQFIDSEPGSGGQPQMAMPDWLPDRLKADPKFQPFNQDTKPGALRALGVAMARMQLGKRDDYGSWQWNRDVWELGEKIGRDLVEKMDMEPDWDSMPESESTSGPGGDMVSKLEAIGGSLWEKHGHKRVYFKKKAHGLPAKVWYDVNKGEWSFRGNATEEEAKEAFARLEAEANGEPPPAPTPPEPATPPKPAVPKKGVFYGSFDSEGEKTIYSDGEVVGSIQKVFEQTDATSKVWNHTGYTVELERPDGTRYQETFRPAYDSEPLSTALGAAQRAAERELTPEPKPSVKLTAAQQRNLDRLVETGPVKVAVTKGAALNFKVVNPRTGEPVKGFRQSSLWDLVEKGVITVKETPAPGFEDDPRNITEATFYPPGVEPEESAPTPKPAISKPIVQPSPKPAPKGTPRREAEEAAEDRKTDHVNARSSKFMPRGRSLGGSIKEKALEWRGMQEALDSDQAKKIFTRKFFEQSDPIDFQSAIDKHFKAESSPAIANVLMAHLMLKKFPATPPKKTMGDPAKMYVEAKIGKMPDDTINANKWWSDMKRLRQEYRDLPASERKKWQDKALSESRETYRKAWEIAKEGIERALEKAGDMSPRDFIKELGREVRGDVRTPEGALVREMTRKLYKGKTAVGKQLTQTVRKINDEVDSSQEHLKRLRQVTEDVVAGDSLAKALGEAKKRKGYTVDIRDMYDTDTLRRSGPPGESDPYRAYDKLMDHFDLREVDFGQYVTDEERAHHLVEAHNALADLTRILGLPPKMASFNGKLGLGLGSHGKGNALAHYDGSRMLINLTRRKGAGSLAHEWGHMFDNILAKVTPGTGKVAFMSEPRVGGTSQMEGPEGLGDMRQTFRDLQASEGFKTFVKRIRERVLDERFSDKERAYWTSNEETFARCFERFVQRKLQSQGQENTYLVSVTREAADEDSLWPTDEETDAMAPYFEAIFKTFRESPMLVKAFMQQVSLAVPLSLLRKNAEWGTGPSFEQNPGQTTDSMPDFSIYVAPEYQKRRAKEIDAAENRIYAMREKNRGFWGPAPERTPQLKYTPPEKPETKKPKLGIKKPFAFPPKGQIDYREALDDEDEEDSEEETSRKRKRSRKMRGRK